MEKTGSVSTQEIGGALVVEWSIESFCTLRSDDDVYYWSPPISFGGGNWYLYIYPNGSSKYDSSGHVSLGLWKWFDGPSVGQSFSLSLETAEGERHGEVHVTKDFDAHGAYHDIHRFMPRSELLSREPELLPDGALTVLCTMRRSARCVTRVEKHTQTEKRALRESCTQTQEREFREASTQTMGERHYACLEKLLMALCIISIIIAIVTGCVLAYSKTPLPCSHPCTEAVTKTQTSEVNNAINGSQLDGSNEIGSTDIKQSKSGAKTQTSVSKRSDVVGSKDFEASGSDETSARDIEEYESINKTLASEMNKIDEPQIAASDVLEASATNQAVKEESEILPQPVLMVTEIGSTYFEVVWVLPEESKSNVADIHYTVHFRKNGAQWKEVPFPDASRTSYSLTNLDPGISYQIYVTAVVPSGFRRSSETATVRTSDKVIHLNSSKDHEDPLVVYAAAIILLFMTIACVYVCSKSSFSVLQAYGEGTQTISGEDDDIIEADMSEVAETDETEASDSVAGATETKGLVSSESLPEDYGFLTNINHLLEENRFTDVTFELETSTGETNKLFAHQLILAVMSSHFADEFYNEGRNKGRQVIALKGVSPKGFQQMIRYCYGENPIFKTIEEAFVLFKVASRFKVVSLQSLCCNYFRHTKINPGNVFSILEISEAMGDESLKNICHKILQNKTREVMASYELRDITPAMVRILLDLPSLSLASEYELIKWIFEWGKTKSEDKDSFCRSTRDCLAEILQNLNFLALTAEEFAILSRENPKVFNSDERASIALNIASPGSWEMPVWYNNDMKCRVYTRLK